MAPCAGRPVWRSALRAARTADRPGGADPDRARHARSAVPAPRAAPSAHERAVVRRPTARPRGHGNAASNNVRRRVVAARATLHRWPVPCLVRAAVPRSHRRTTKVVGSASRPTATRRAGRDRGEAFSRHWVDPPGCGFAFAHAASSFTRIVPRAISAGLRISFHGRWHAVGARSAWQIHRGRRHAHDRPGCDPCAPARTWRPASRRGAS